MDVEAMDSSMRAFAPRPIAHLRRQQALPAAFQRSGRTEIPVSALNKLSSGRAGGAPARGTSLLVSALQPTTYSSPPAPSAAAQTAQQQMVKEAYLSMARPINLLPSMLLVIFGAWASTGQLLRVLGSGAVWLVSFLASGVAVASVMVNDYFDFRSGADNINSPQKPLPSGLIPPDQALLLSAALYIAVLTATCFMGQSALRSVIAISAAATVLYTPLLKRLTGIKNATVAAVITASPLAGALAAGAGKLQLARLLPLCAFVFLGILYREILMDITDEEGDRDAGVQTIPVVAGSRAALGVALTCVSTAGALLLNAALHGRGLAWAVATYGLSTQDARAVALVAACAIAAPVARAAAEIWRRDFDKGVVSAAIDASMRSIGIGVIFLALII